MQKALYCQVNLKTPPEPCGKINATRGMQRMVMLVTGIANIRDVLPFARTPGNIDF